jgi:brassinosteroid-6-oxidase 1
LKVFLNHFQTPFAACDFQMAFFITLKQIVDEESDTIHQALKAEFDKLVLGTLSLPIKLPGTNYRRGFEV